LRKVGNYEEVLAQAIKDEQHVDGVINPYLANAATRIINNPEFQRVKDRLEDDLTQQTKNHMDQQNFEHHVTNLAVDARINRSDLDYIISNLQQPPQPPAPPPQPPHDAADRARLIAELDGLAQERERQSRQEMLAQRNAMDLAAQSVATPAQQIVREYHHHHMTQPIYIPTPQVPQQTPIHIHTPQQDYSDMMRQFGMTMQQAFLAQQQVPVQRRPPEDIPITYAAGSPPPPPAPGAGAIARSYGPARIPKERMMPFQSGGGPPPAPGGATAPMPTQTVPERPKISRETVPVRREYFPRRRRPDMPEPPAQPDEPRRVKRKAPQQATPVSLKPYRVPRGPGHQLPDEPPSFVPFSGRAQRLPEDNQGSNLRANAMQRMRELGHQGEQARRGREMVDRMGDLGRAIRRGGARGDVVGPGKRKREAEVFAPNPRQRIGDRAPGPQQFSIAT
jgi:hypothetical protein